MSSIGKFYLTFLFATIYSFCCAASSVRFAFLTDTHISTDDTLSSKHLLRLIDLINTVDSIDFIVVCGDVTHKADSASLKHAKYLLDQLDRPYFCIAGNHDHHQFTTQTFQQIFSNDKFCFTQEGLRFIGFSPTPQQESAEAIIPESTLLWIKQQISNKEPNILLCHYPLQQGDIANLHMLTQCFDSSNILITLSGHYHRYMLMGFQNIPNIVNRAPQRTGDSTIGYTLYDIDHNTIRIYEHICGEQPNLWMVFPR